MQDGDSIIFANFRSDRAKELSAALFEDQFDGFDRGKMPLFGSAATMTLYYINQNASIAFPNSITENTLGEIMSVQGKKQ
jgi:2,3-bisphosphoglycerate-independent phosphoglycerate mutase